MGTATGRWRWTAPLMAMAFVGTMGVLLLAAGGGAGAADTPKEVLLGTTLSLTGKFSVSAERWGKMTEVFQEVYNQRFGGVYLRKQDKKVPVRFIYYDDKSEPQHAVAMYERLATVDRVDFLVGPDWSPIGFPVATVPEKHKIPIVMSNVASPKVYARGFKYLFGTPMPGVEVWSDAYLALMRQQPGVKRIAFFAEDLLWSKDVAEWAAKKAKALGFDVVFYELFRAELKDYSSLILKAKALNPDIVYISAYEEPTIGIVRQMKELDLNAKNFHITMNSGQVTSALGPKLTHTFTGDLAWYYGMRTPYSDFVKEVLEKSDVSVEKYIWTMSRLTSYLVMLQAVQRAGSLDREAVREALRAGTFESPVGNIRFEQDGHAIVPGHTNQYQHGQVVIVAPESVATGKLIFPTPPWAAR